MEMSHDTNKFGADKNPCWSMWTEYAYLQEFASFMRQVPEKLLQDSTGTKSYRTSAPTSYDKHLVDRQVLKHVICLPHLANWVGRAMDEQMLKLVAKHKKLPPVNRQSLFPTKEGRDLAMDAVADRVRYERGVVDQYMSAVGYSCGIIASTMMLHPSPRTKTWQSFLTFTTDPPEHELESQGGIADLYFKISNKFQSNKPNLKRTLGLSETKMQRWEAVRHHFPFLMPFEMKSLLSGNGTVMKEIEELGNRGPKALFPWESCEDSSCSTGHDFSVGPHGRDGSVLDKILSEAKEDHPRPWWLNQNLPSPHRLSFGFSDHDTSEDEHSSGYISSDSADEKGADYYRIEYVSDSDIAVIDPPGSVEDHIQSAEHILQQVWSQAVRIDATFLAILAGNYEIIGVRHRESQTLYISPVIEVGTGLPHNRLHTGLYISALKDALERTDKIQANRKVNGGHPELPKDLKDFIPPTVVYKPDVVGRVKDRRGDEIMPLHRDRGVSFFGGRSPSGSGSSPETLDPEATTPKAQNTDLPVLDTFSTTQFENIYSSPTLDEESGLYTPRASRRELPQGPYEHPGDMAVTTDNEQRIDPHSGPLAGAESSRRRYRTMPERRPPPNKLPPNSAFSLYATYTGFTSEPPVASSSRPRDNSTPLSEGLSLPPKQRKGSSPTQRPRPLNPVKRMASGGDSTGTAFSRRRK